MNQGELEDYRVAAEQGDADAAYKMGNIHYDGWKDRSSELSERLCSDEVRDFELKNKATPQQERDLLFSAVLMGQNWQSLTVLPMIKDSQAARNAVQNLREAWGINTNVQALDTIVYLAEAGNHTADVDAKYKGIISTSELNRRRPSGEFNTAKAMLMRFGYTEQELMELPTLAAWDYGRCGFIARLSRQIGYIDDKTAWEHISRCAENAAAKYDSWRQYLAAYVLGRALWGSDCLDLEYVLAHLLCHPNSPFKRGIDIKPGHKEAPWNFQYKSCIIEANHAEAAKWYRKAAELGHANGQCTLGYCYATGEGVQQDLVEAVTWYRKAAEQGNATAQYNLGNCYQNCKGVISKDMKLAEEWYRKAAEQGYKDAQQRLAKIKLDKSKKRNKFIIIGIVLIIIIVSYIKGRTMI